MSTSIDPDAGPTRLERKLRLFSATNVVVADMIGVGIFTTSGLILGELGNPGLMIVLWAAGGVLALLGALCYGELGAAMPRAGGEYVYLSRLYHPIFGFLTGWVSLFAGFSAPLAASALGFGEYFGRAFPGLSQGPGERVLSRAMAVTAIAVLTLVHLRGIEFGSRIQNYLTVGKVLLIVGLVAAGLSIGHGHWSHFSETAGSPSPTGGWRAVGLSLMWIMFAYSGWNASAYIGSEISDPERNLPRSLLLGTGTVLFLYLCLNVLFVYATPPADMEGVIAVGGLAASRLFGPRADAGLCLLISFALLSSISALIVLGPRVYYAMARDGYFFRVFSEVHPVARVPARSIVLQSSLAVAMVLTGTFDQILTYMGFCLGIFPILAAVGLFRLRSEGGSVARMPGHPFVALTFAAVSVAILWLALMERPVESSVAIGTVLLGLPVYVAFTVARRRNGPRQGPCS